MSVPAQIRRRWATSIVVAEDRGDHLIVRPAPEDPIAAAHGVFAEELGGVALAELRRGFRHEEAEIEDRKSRPYRSGTTGRSTEA